MYQSTHTGAQVDEAVDKALSADAVPTPSSTNLVQSGGVFGVVSNRNLLDNWYFVNPVNQRGRTSYSTNNAYCIDRWKYFGTIPMNLQSDGIRLGDTTSNTVTYIRQVIDTPQLYAGKALTYSVLVKDLAGTGNKGFIRWYANGTEQTASIITGELTTLTLTIPSSPTSLYFDIGSYWNNAFTAVSVKLELGSVSTLANDAPPNFAEELAKCQRFFYRFSGLASAYTVPGSSVSAITILFPVTMRGVPSISNITYYDSKTANGQGTFVSGAQFYNSSNVGFSVTGFDVSADS